MPERIAFDARYINDQYHSIGRYAFRLLEAMVAAAPEATFIVFRGRECDTRFNWDTLAAQPNVEIRGGPWPLYWPHEQLVWPHLLRRSRADVFHSPYFVAPLFAPCPVVVTVHDLIFDRYPQYAPRNWARPYYRAMLKWSTRRAYRIVAVSQATASDLMRYHQISANKIAVIPAGVDPECHPVTDTNKLYEILSRHDLKRPFILAVGTRRPHKNLARLVTAVAHARIHAAYDLVLAGPGDSHFTDEAQQAAHELQLNGRVRFLDWVSEADLPGLYTLARLVVVPSLLEGFGSSALEAMACGAPVAASDVSSLREVVGDAGALFDPRDVDELAAVLQELVHDPARRKRMTEAGLRRAAMFNWQQAAYQTLQVLRGRPIGHPN